MKVLLVAMPRTTSSLHAILSVPSLAICSIAGNLDDCDTRCLDLSLYRGRIAALLRHVMQAFSPDLVGITAMTHQYEDARRVALLCKSIKPQALTALGGAHATALAEEIAEGNDRELFDFLVRGEGELVFKALVRELEKPTPRLAAIKGLSFLTGNGYKHNALGKPPDLTDIRLPDRDSRILQGPRFGLPVIEPLETSRAAAGEKGKSARRLFSIDRVMEELGGLAERGMRAVWFVDDDMAADPKRLKELCQRVESEKLQTLSSTMHVSIAGMEKDEKLPSLMARAGVRCVVLELGGGIDDSPWRPKAGAPSGKARVVVEALRKEGIAVIGDLTVGGPDTTRGDIHLAWRYVRDLGVDHPVVRILTPYPKTQVRERLVAEGLVTNINDYSRYTGYQANVRTRHLSAAEISRWLVLYGSRLYFSPRYIVRSRLWWRRPPGAPAMLALNFRFLTGGAHGRLFVRQPRW